MVYNQLAKTLFEQVLKIKLFQKLVICGLCLVCTQAEARIVFQDDSFHDIESEGIVVDANASGGNITFKMGNTGNDGVIVWDTGNSKFNIQNSTDVNGSLNVLNNLAVSGQVNFSNALQTRVREIVGFNPGPGGTACTDNGELAVDKNNSDLYICSSAVNDTWDLLSGGGGNLDQAYNNFGAAASTVVVDAAQGQTGSLLFQGSLSANPTMLITNSANGGALQVQNNGSGLSFRVDDSFGDTSPFLIDQDGKVGVGTTAPVNPLHINYNGDVIRIGNNTASNLCIVFDDDGVTDRKICWDDALASFTTGNIPLISSIRSTATPGSCDSTNNGQLWRDTDNGSVYVCDFSKGKWLSVTDKLIWGEGLNANCGGNVNSLLQAPNCGAKLGSSLGYTNTHNGIWIPEDITITGLGFSISQGFGQNNCSVHFSVISSTNPFNFQATGAETTLSIWNVGNNQTIYTYNVNNLNVDIPGGRYINFGPEPKNCQVIQSFIMSIQYRSKGS